MRLDGYQMSLEFHFTLLLQILKEPVVCELARKYTKSTAQILLRWAVQQDIGMWCGILKEIVNELKIEL